MAPMSCCFRRGLVLVKQTADPGSNPRSSKKRGKMTIPAKHSQIVVVVPFYSQALGVKIKQLKETFHQVVGTDISVHILQYSLHSATLQCPHYSTHITLITDISEHILQHLHSIHYSTYNTDIHYRSDINVIFQFAAEVYKKVKENGHEIVGVFTIPDANNREDPVAAVAR